MRKIIRQPEPVKFRALLVVDNTSIRRETSRAYRAAAQQLASLQKQWTLFSDRDQPAFRSWYQSTFANLLRLIQECTYEIYQKQTLIESVTKEAAARGITLAEAYNNVLNGNTYAESQRDYDEHLYGSDDFEAARELFEEALRTQGIPPDSIDAEEYEARFIRFKSDLNFEGNQNEREEDQQQDDDDFAPPPNARVRDLYRKLALRLHPDVAKNVDSQLWLAAQRAYEQRDIGKLESLWKSLGSDEAVDLQPQSIWEMKKQIEEVFQSIRSMKKKVKRAKKDHAWGFSRQESKKRIRKTRSLIQKELGSELEEAQEVLATLTEFVENWLSTDLQRTG